MQCDIEWLINRKWCAGETPWTKMRSHHWVEGLRKVIEKLNSGSPISGLRYESGKTRTQIRRDTLRNAMSGSSISVQVTVAHNSRHVFIILWLLVPCQIHLTISDDVMNCGDTINAVILLSASVINYFTMEYSYPLRYSAIPSGK